VGFHHWGPLLNNLIWSDPYGVGLTGDAASTWTISNSGKTVTFKIIPGITFHDGKPLTSADVLYNIDRGVNPRDATMTAYTVRFANIESVEAPDDLTFVMNLKAPSNSLMATLGGPGVLIFPAHIPFPEQKDAWKDQPIGSGPYKSERSDHSIKLEFSRYDSYFKIGMPYMDAIVKTAMRNDSAVAAFRAGRLDATNLDSTPTINQLELLERDLGWIPKSIVISIPHVELNQVEPFTNKRVRQAVSLALDRHALNLTWLLGKGSPYTASLISPQFGGQWGLPSDDFIDRPGWRADKGPDLAAAKLILEEEGVDPGDFKLKITGTTTYPVFAETVADSMRNLGFKIDIDILPSGTLNDQLGKGDFHVNALSPTFTFDDIGDRVVSQIYSTGPFNYGKWVNPELDSLIDAQEIEQDPAARVEMLRQIQEIILDEASFIPMIMRFGFHGWMPHMRNMPTNIKFIFDSWNRWEQVWKDN